MKENFKKIIASVLTFTLVLTMLSAFALPTKAEAPAEETAHKTKVVITKWDTSSDDNKAIFTTAKEHDGKEIKDGNIPEYLNGKIPKGIKGVKFTLYKAINDEKLAKLEEVKDDMKKLDALVTSEGASYSKTETTFTDDEGKVEVELDDGYYLVVESTKPAGYDNSLAVPFKLVLPAFVDGKRVGDQDAAAKLYIYPKNELKNPFDPTDDTNPGLKKSIVSGSQEKNFETFDKGEEVSWKIAALAPKAIKDYTKLNILDKLSSKLDYVANSVQVSQEGNESQFTVDTDYQVTFSERLLKVSFTASGIKKLEADKKINVLFKTKIKTDEAVMGDRIYNGVEVIYAVQPGNEGSSEIPANPNVPRVVTPPSTTGTTIPETPQDPDDVPKGTVPEGGTGNIPPSVAVGGKKFVKVDYQEANTKLEGAEFVVVKKVEDKYKILTKVTADGSYKWVDLEGVNDSTSADDMRKIINELERNDSEVIKLSSAATTGEFEIKGLKYGTYNLLEMVAPKGYALGVDKVTFTIDDSSYYTNLKAETLDADTNLNKQNVQNKKYTIPQTGGIGTIVFIVAGVVMMGAALLLYKKGRAE